MRAEQEESQRQKDRLQKERNLKSEFSALQDEKNLLEQVHKRRHANLTHMAQFLVAGSASTDAGAEGEGLTKRPPPMADRLPMHASPTSSSLPPLYFKPYKLTDAQSATIEAQISDARAALESDQEAHVKQMEELDDKIDEKARAKDRFEEERERAERLERLEKRRAEEGDEDDDMGRDAPTRSRSPPPQRSERDTTSRDREDVRME